MGLLRGGRVGGGEAAPEELMAALRRLAGRLLREGLGVCSVVLFGSYARGEWLRDSDVDLLVVAEGFRGRPFYEREYIVLRLWDGGWPLEPWCYTPEEVLEVLRGRPRMNVVDALEHGVVVCDDGFWRMLGGLTWLGPTGGGLAVASYSVSPKASWLQG